MGLMIPGKPKSSTVISVGHEGTHGGVNVAQGGMIDDYPMKFGIVAHKKPESSRKPRDQSGVLKQVVPESSSTTIKRRRIFGVK